MTAISRNGAAAVRLFHGHREEREQSRSPCPAMRYSQYSITDNAIDGIDCEGDVSTSYCAKERSAL